MDFGASAKFERTALSKEFVVRLWGVVMNHVPIGA